MIQLTSGSSSVLAEKTFLRFPFAVDAMGFSRDIGEECWDFVEFSPEFGSIYDFECCGLQKKGASDKDKGIFIRLITSA